jgi:hypothetical protein
VRGDCGGELRLLSLTRDVVWPAGEPLHARCSLHRGVPGQRCTCGIYAADSPPHLARARVFTGSASVVGAIAMWGTVVEHASGARSEHAYPARLRLVCAPCLQLGRGGIEPRVVVGSGDAMVALCRLHGVRQGRLPSRPATDVQAELLSTYGVQLMPLERVGRPLRAHRPKALVDPDHVVRGVVRAVFATLGFLIHGYFALTLVLMVAMFCMAIVGGIVRTITGDDPSEDTAANAAPPSVAPVPGFTTMRESPPPRAGTDMPPPPSFAIVCGAPDGRSVRIVGCGSGQVGLLGFGQEDPQGVRDDCAGSWDAYSRGRTYSICWTELRSTAPAPRRPSSQNPFVQRRERRGHR